MEEKIINVITKKNTYDKPKGKIVVNSHFSNDTPISELIYRIISKNIETKAA